MLLPQSPAEAYKNALFKWQIFMIFQNAVGSQNPYAWKIMFCNKNIILLYYNNTILG